MNRRAPPWMVLLLALPVLAACPGEDEAASVDDDDSAADDDDETIADDDDSAVVDERTAMDDGVSPSNDDDAVPMPTLGDLAGFHPLGELDYGGKGPVSALTRTPTSVLIGGQSYVSFIRGFLHIEADEGADEGRFALSITIVSDEPTQESIESTGRVTHEARDAKLVFVADGRSTVWRYHRIGDALDLTYASDDPRNKRPPDIHRMRGASAAVPTLGIEGAWTIGEVVLPQAGDQVAYTDACVAGRDPSTEAAYFRLIGSVDFDPRGRLDIQLVINRHRTEGCSDTPSVHFEVQGRGWFDYDGWAYAHWIAGSEPTSLSATVDAQSDSIVLTRTGDATSATAIDALTLIR